MSLPRPRLQGQVSPTLLLVVALLPVGHGEAAVAHALGLLLGLADGGLLRAGGVRRGGRRRGLGAPGARGARLAVLHQDRDGHSARRARRLQNNNNNDNGRDRDDSVILCFGPWRPPREASSIKRATACRPLENTLVSSGHVTTLALRSKPVTPELYAQGHLSRFCPIPCVFY